MSMKKTLRLTLWCLLVVLPATAFTQIGIPGTRFSFNLNADNWQYLRSFKAADGADVHLYCYTGRILVEPSGDTALPNLRIYVNPHFDGDLYSLVYNRYLLQPYQSLGDYTRGLGLPATGGIGYKGGYTNPADQKTYFFRMTYFADKKAAVEFRLETTQDTFSEMEPEFEAILKTIK